VFQNTTLLNRISNTLWKHKWFF